MVTGIDAWSPAPVLLAAGGGKRSTHTKSDQETHQSRTGPSRAKGGPHDLGRSGPLGARTSIDRPQFPTDQERDFMTDHSALITPAAERRRLTRAEQLTLTTWRWAFVALCRQVEPQDLLPQVALQAVLARLRDCTDPLQLFGRHCSPEAEFALVASLLTEESPPGARPRPGRQRLPAALERADCRRHRARGAAAADAATRHDQRG